MYESIVWQTQDQRDCCVVICSFVATTGRNKFTSMQTEQTFFKDTFISSCLVRCCRWRIIARLAGFRPGIDMVSRIRTAKDILLKLSLTDIRPKLSVWYLNSGVDGRSETKVGTRSCTYLHLFWFLIT